MKNKNKEVLERNIIDSFRLAKSDIIKLQSTVNQIADNQERMMEWITDTREKEIMLYNRLKRVKMTKRVRKKPVKKSKRPAKRKKYVASKKGNKVHDSNCPFAKNIKPKSKIKFQSKIKALNQGYKACECLKKL